MKNQFSLNHCVTLLAGAMLLLPIISSAALLPLSNPTIISSAPAFPGYGVNFALDGDLSMDYASNGQGANTFIDFDFGISTLIAEVQYTDRTSSGGPNGSNAGGPSDNVTEFSLIFSEDLTFGDVGDLIINVTSPGFADTDIVSINAGNGVSARFLRWDVITTSGFNPGAAEFSFSTTNTVPTPAIVTLLFSGLLARRLFTQSRAKVIN